MDLDLAECPDTATLIDRAHRETGLTDLGDPARNAGLEAFVSTLRNDTWTTMAPRARELAVDFLVHNLSARLRLIADRKAHPGIAQQRIERPLIVVGPPRSGSTLLHTLLSLDPDNMAMEHWICREPSPPPSVTAPSAERLQAAENRMNDLFGLIPDIFITTPT